jgi:pimeloyl-ACP methyl ester carboxylesterase
VVQGVRGTLIALLALLIGPAGAAAQRTPALTVAPDRLEGSLACKRLGEASRPAVLLVHGTSETPAMFDWNWLRFAEARRWPYCTVALPEAGTADVQPAAEHLVYAIRRMHAATGRRVQVVGHSQGGMLPR